MFQLNVSAISYALPERKVTNADLDAENPSWDLVRSSHRIGVETRYIAETGETSLDLAVTACDRLFNEVPGIDRNEVDGLIFCTQSPDHIMPPNSALLHRELGLQDSVLAFDFNLACSGYVYGLAIAEGLLASKRATSLLLVNADTYSKFIHPGDRSTRALFGDGAAVSWLTTSQTGPALVDLLCATWGGGADKFIIPAGGCRQPRSLESSQPHTDESGNTRTAEDIHMDGMGMVSFVSTKVPPQIRQLLERNSLTLEDIDLFIFHQASGLVLDTLQRFLRIPPEKSYRTLGRMGNTVSASIPIALRDAFDEGEIAQGSRVLISGFGVGLSWASAILQY
ncbi:MAG: ketoacyl-ACP synthase III [Acidobacteriota bacterium]|nr:MAG: ketoacyl-ACP synthase III [Acidobacteriota bacterium]